jgi:uncharacterized repeat protein (TIGR03809 family)
MSEDLARRWRALAEQRRAHFAALYHSGRWKLYYTETQFRLAVRQTVELLEAWKAIAPASNIAELRMSRAEPDFAFERAFESLPAAPSARAPSRAVADSGAAFPRGLDASHSPLARRLAGGHAAWKAR